VVNKNLDPNKKYHSIVTIHTYNYLLQQKKFGSIQKNKIFLNLFSLSEPSRFTVWELKDKSNNS
jgi:hypothetical protein